MNPISRFIKRVRALVHRRGSDAEFGDELRFHTDMEAADLRREGVSPDDAQREAMRRLGGVDRYTEELRDVRGGRRVEAFVRDVRHAFRVARRAPGFAMIVVLTLGLTIGANTALFSVVNATILRPLPFPRDRELVALFAQNPDGTSPRFGVSHADYLDWRRETTSFSEMALYAGSTFTIAGGDGEPERLTGVVATHNFFRVLQATPALGQFFGPADEDGATSEAVVISHGFWMRRFGGDSAIVGKRIEFTTATRTVIGVLPANFGLGARAADAYVVLAPAGIPGIENHGQHLFQSVARLKPGVTRDEAQQDLRAVATRIASQHADITGWSANAFGLRDEIMRTARNPLLVLLAAAGLVLLIGCSNLANLYIVRGAMRGREMGLRRALGASRTRLVSQMLVESGVLAAAGGAVGIGVAFVGTRLVLGLVPAGLIPRIDETNLDARVLGFAAALSIMTALAVALWPALRATRTDLARTLRDGGRGSAGSSYAARVRRTLVVAEVSLALVLLVCSGLVLQSLRDLLNADPGFRADRVVTMRLTLAQARFTDSVRISFYREFISRLEQRAGIEGAGGANTPPISGGGINTPIRLIGQPTPPGDQLMTPATAITPGYFRTLGMRIIRGRDVEWGEARPAMLVSESAARRLWPGDEAVGKRIAFSPNDATGNEVVGVVADARARGLTNDAPPMVYLAYEGAINLLRTMSFVVRGAGDVPTTLATTKSVLRELDPTLPVYDVRPVVELVDASIAQPRLNTSILAAFATIALLLAGIGIYGVVSYSVAQRRQEIGVRVALGARASDVVRLVLREGGMLAVGGALVGIAGAYALTPVVRRWIYGVGSVDVLTLGAMVAALITVALMACVVPARRAMRVDPVTAMRAE